MKIINAFISKFKKVHTFEKKLIQELKKEHRKLFAIFNKIEKNLEKGKYGNVLNALKKFHYEYRLHIIYEDNYFYTYVKNKYKHDGSILNFINRKHQEMEQISRSIASFIKRFDNVNEIKTERFKKELQQLSKALKSRIEFEEQELYTLYL
ncbi:hemerythrin domain-containing protein [Nautilia sp.]